MPLEPQLYGFSLKCVEVQQLTSQTSRTNMLRGGNPTYGIRFMLNYSHRNKIMSFDFTCLRFLSLDLCKDGKFVVVSAMLLEALGSVHKGHANLMSSPRLSQSLRQHNKDNNGFSAPAEMDACQCLTVKKVGDLMTSELVIEAQVNGVGLYGRISRGS